MAWPDASSGSAESLCPAAFLDRDGVINMDSGYVARPMDLRFTPTAVEGIRLLNDAGYRVIVVSNQSGVARGYFGIDEVEAFHRQMQAELGKDGARIDAFYYCPYHPSGTVAEFAMDHPDRKPNPGMLFRAMKDWPTQKEGSFLVGDKTSDVGAARAAGIASVLVPKDDCDLASVVRERLSLAPWSR